MMSICPTPAATTCPGCGWLVAGRLGRSLPGAGRARSGIVATLQVTLISRRIRYKLQVQQACDDAQAKHISALPMRLWLQKRTLSAKINGINDITR